MRVVQAKSQKNKVVHERYVIDDLLGQGGSGAVYRVRDCRVKGNVFALKEVIEPTSHQRERFAFESTILQRLDHYALPHVYRVFEDPQTCRVYMLMDYIAGPDLEQLRLQQPDCRFSLAQAIRVMRPIVEAVMHLHAQLPPIIHRDIKPANIVVPTSGAAAVLVDFGIAKEYNPTSTTTAVRHCSPGYGAPEQYMHGTNTQTDMYGLAATFYTLLTGQVPIDALYRLTRMSARSADPLKIASSLIPSIPLQAAEVLQRALSIDPLERFTSIADFWTALQACPQTDFAPIFDEKPVIVTMTTAQPAVLTTGKIALSLATSIDCASQVLSPWSLLRRSCISSRYIPATLLTIILLALCSGMLFGHHAWQHSNQNQGHGPLVQTRTGTHAHHITTRAVGSTPTPTRSPDTTNNTQPPLYPRLALTYSGSIYNTPTAINTIMALSRIQQHAGTIKGYVYAAQGLIQNSHFVGNVTTNNLLVFTITRSTSLLPLSFTGHIQANGTISGTYCSLQNGLCDYDEGGYGNWEVYS